MEKLLYVISVALSLFVPSSSFNLNLVSPIKYKGSSGSYFGYSVALHKTSKGPIALIGSPKSNSSLNWSNAREPGAIIKCPLYSPHDCQEVGIDSNAAAGSNEVRDGMWLGMSLSTNEKESSTGNVLACAPRLVVKYSEDKYYGNGMCLVWDRDLNAKSTRKLNPLSTGPQTEVIITSYVHKYAFGQQGLSSYVDQETGEMMMGAPGLYEWSGGIVQYPEFSYEPNIPLMPPDIKEKSPYIYTGYSITSGLFFEHSRVQYVLGAPRAHGHMGQVYICELLKSKVDSKVSTMNITNVQSGRQVGEYFGASVLAVNLNGDKLMDLVVGAPMFTGGDKFDIGRIHIYISSGVGLEEKEPCTVNTLSAGARFGSTLAALGDLNKDGFQDIAVGAPYDNDKGAVYIFFGSDSGLVCHVAQKIEAADVNVMGPGFGAGISAGMDIDNNEYPDVLIGSYGDSSAVLLRSHSVVQVSPKITSTATVIDMALGPCTPTTGPTSVPCFTVHFHIKYNGKSVPPVTTIRLNVTLDRELQEKGLVSRGFFELNDGNTATSFQEDLQLNRNIEKSIARKVFIQASSVKYNTPMSFFMSYELKQESAGVCVTCPIVDRTSATHAELKVPFKTVCEHGGSCKADILLDAKILEQKSVGKPFIIGMDDLLTIKVTVTNRGESAYDMKVMMELPSELPIINFGRCYRIDSSPVHLTRRTTLECLVGNPFGKDETHSLEVKVSTFRLKSENQTLEFAVEATTTSETTKRDIVHLKAVFITNLTLDFIGVSDPDTMNVKADTQDSVKFRHIYRVRALYTEVPSVRLKFYLPGVQEEFTGISVEASGSASCYSSDDIDLIPAQFVQSRPKRSTENEAKLVHKKSTLSCEDSVCKVVTCYAGPIKRDQSGIVTISTLLNLTALKNKANYELQDVDYFTSRGEAYIAMNRVGLTTATTKLVKEGSLPAKPVPIWVFIVSGLGGLLFLFLIIFALYKMGFFKRRRPQKDEPRSSKLLQTESAENAEEEAEKRKSLL